MLDNNYWAAISGPAPEDDGPLLADRDVDIAIIGAGYTGLSSAYHIAKSSDADVVVLEAETPAFGCSGRNGGNCRSGLGRRSAEWWIKQKGMETAQAVFREQQASFDTARQLMAEGQIDCDQSGNGWLRIAHKANRTQQLESTHKVLRDVFKHKTHLVSADDLSRNYVRTAEGFGALLTHEAIGVNPLKLSYGVLRMARAAGAKVHGKSPVIDWQKHGDRHVLITPGGRVRASQVIMATNGYGDEKILPAMGGLSVSVSSVIGVTRPLSEAELAEAGFHTFNPLSDTRHLVFYYRRLPDNRILMGGRGPTPFNAAAKKKAQKNILQAVHRKFPMLSDVTLDYFWQGRVCMTMDGVPHVSATADDPTVYYAFGYNGIGVASSLHSGRRLAERVTGQSSGLEEARGLPHLLPAPKMPFAAFRSLGLRGMMAMYKLQDMF